MDASPENARLKKLPAEAESDKVILMAASNF
jgi:hypothetical protein